MSKQDDNRGQTPTSQQIENQLAEGRRLLELQIQTHKDLERAAARRSVWVEKNIRLLNDCPIPNNVKNRLLSQISLDNTNTGEDFDAEVDSLRDITKIQMNVLENASALMTKAQEEPAPDLKKEAAEPLSPRRPSETINPKAALSFKEQLEHHPMGFAAIICAACISIVIVGMSWYHGESERALINNYEMKLTGLKNDMEAQRRTFEEQIRKLNDELAKKQEKH